MIRLGTVPYCNAFPLTHFLPDVLPDAELTSWYPSAMRQQLLTGRLDLALMPVAELLHIPNAEIVSHCCIACNGEVRSVRLISKKPLTHIKTLALDTASRSSVTICLLILRHFYAITPAVETLPPDLPLDSCPADAFVVIGDRSLSYKPAEQWQYRYDIGTLWKENTGLPLVFAAWIGLGAGSADVMSAEVIAALETSRDKGLANLEMVLREKQQEGVVLPAAVDDVLDYYRNAIVYTLGGNEQKSLRLFLELSGKQEAEIFIVTR
jgi:chorismate dehydratase